MPLDVDSLIERGLTLKREGGSGRQLSEFLEREGADEGARRFILRQIDKRLLKEHQAKGSGMYQSMKGFLGFGLMAGGALLGWFLWAGIDGWNVISTVPFIMFGAGLWVLNSK
ncbi:MAG: hypothetical protein KF905_05150 [Flavobacteriales bacterium]|nr:hypothetical protein [Flavobacteriales bacterium]